LPWHATPRRQIPEAVSRGLPQGPGAALAALAAAPGWRCRWSRVRRHPAVLEAAGPGQPCQRAGWRAWGVPHAPRPRWGAPGGRQPVLELVPQLAQNGVKGLAPFWGTLLGPLPHNAAYMHRTLSESLAKHSLPIDVQPWRAVHKAGRLLPAFVRLHVTPQHNPCPVKLCWSNPDDNGASTSASPFTNPRQPCRWCRPGPPVPSRLQGPGPGLGSVVRGPSFRLQHGTRDAPSQTTPQHGPLSHSLLLSADCPSSSDVPSFPPHFGEGAESGPEAAEGSGNGGSKACAVQERSIGFSRRQWAETKTLV